MPYILPGMRKLLKEDQKRVGEVSPPLDASGPGELSYVIAKAVDSFLGGDPSFTRMSEAIGALECTKLEIYRRLVAPYEDRKCDHNGDVFFGTDQR